ncbi:MAG: metallophosphoesterase, partial [Candidatus Omnitrophica bacterium]|nr:metallophosphoesterase [Candidatus Omnitrophota bacterium]
SGAFIKDKDNRIYYTQDNTIPIESDKHYIINVGSVGQPRDGNPRACFSIYDEEKKYVWIKRIDYDIKKTQEKIKDAGLPQFLAERLSIGR